MSGAVCLDCRYGGKQLEPPLEKTADLVANKGAVMAAAAAWKPSANRSIRINAAAKRGEIVGRASLAQVVAAQSPEASPAASPEESPIPSPEPSPIAIPEAAPARPLKRPASSAQGTKRSKK